MGDRVALQGNLDPAILLSNPESISTAAVDILKSYGQGSGHVFNLGHGIDPSTPIENVAALVEAVQNFSIKNENQSVVIIGSGLAGYLFAKEFRKLDTTTPLEIITANEGVFILNHCYPPL